MPAAARDTRSPDDATDPVHLVQLYQRAVMEYLCDRVERARRTCRLNDPALQQAQQPTAGWARLVLAILTAHSRQCTALLRVRCLLPSRRWAPAATGCPGKRLSGADHRR